jgi:formylglycine-generating enzyme required for sulfatase activity
MIKIFTLVIIVGICFHQLNAQKIIPAKLPDTGQTNSYTTTKGEDADCIINPPSYTDNGDGTITDNNTGLMWQKTDGGETTFENAITYCDNLTLAGYADWRLPSAQELFAINNHNNINPAMNTIYFTKTTAEYWWTSETRADDVTRVWLVNAGGGIGAHLKTETISAGGTRYVHVRAVRNPYSTTFSISHFTDNGNGTITDNYTGLTWQKIQSTTTMTWEEALVYCSTFSLGGKTDWRLPNIKELQSLNDVKLSKPSFNKTYFTNILAGNYWSSTTLQNTSSKAWDINMDYGIVSYNDKTLKENVLLVRGGSDDKDLNLIEVQIPSGTFEMGDHIGFVDPGHPTDELPMHSVKIDSMYMTKTPITNQQYLTYLNSALLKGLIEVRSNIVYATGGTDIYCYTNQFASYYNIGYDGKVFYIADFRANHPVVGVMWFGSAAYCNWMSQQKGLQECYNLSTWACDFTKSGYRLPTEAEWEYAGRGGQYNPYLNYPWGSNQDITRANWPDSKDPYEGTLESAYPFTTPVGFYDGNLHLKSEYNWPGSATSYQTTSSTNGFGLQDMAGNVWQFVNDWYGNNYYSLSPSSNPTGPTTGSNMPDGKTYRAMRGGCWYNGDIINSVNDGHSRVSNRNPSYFRGPQDPNHPWYHISFRIARKFIANTTGISIINGNISSLNYPNPFNASTTIQFELTSTKYVTLRIYNSSGQLITSLVNEKLSAGLHSYQWNSLNNPGGIYSYTLQIDNQTVTKKMILIR